MGRKISDEYRTRGVDAFYRSEGALYRNPHESAAARLLEEALDRLGPNKERALDLACGSGEATVVLEGRGFSSVDAVDPYTGEAYRKRTGKTAESATFQDIAQGCLAGRSYDVIVCSFALHLPERSWLPRLCYNLSTISQHLIILTPIKRPEIRRDWGWELDFEIMADRVRARVYRSSNKP